MKRLRKKQSKITDQKLKYYAVGEYGTKTKRPHYHAIIFGIHPKIVDKIQEAWSIYRDKQFYPIGHVDIGDVNNNSIDYVTKYVINRYEFKGYVAEPFTLISNGIGEAHLKKNFNKYYSSETVRSERGYIQKIPRYYRDKLNQNKYSHEFRKQKFQELVEKRKAEELERLSKTYSNPEKYDEQRKMAANDKISRNAKNNEKI
jgi:hypothetical protein